MSESKTPKKPTGLKARKEARAWEAEMELRTYRPEELLNPAELLVRFTEKARELVDRMPDESRPISAEVTAVLRQAVLEAFRTREQYVARLVETDSASWMTAMPAKSLRRAIRASLVDSGIRVVESSDEREHFVVVEGEGDGFEVVRPAYVDQATGKLILSGQLRRVFVGKRSDDATAAQHATAVEEKP
ncbi:hypothetical protein G3I32_09905 [Streptomyces coelicoflavus]|uniref:Uncharacterized protein n=1 Tax=Streptomyces coelicoflavus TaxID=285562 RepID=A0A7K3PH00_9ACTN|nr:hypothetical protein [Streptomyces coelicoflavus]NEB09182.1 hypothetical protein [Streptomyces coelicoflavus]